MREMGLNKDKFWQVSPAAAEIFEYIRSNKELKSTPWGFDIGGVSEDRQSTYASFSCTSSSGWGKDELTVFASLAKDGTWTLKHTIKLADQL